jgi:phage gp46-like protein
MDFRLDPETRDLAREGVLTLAEDGGLSTAVILSLFLNARASIDDPLPDPNSDDRGGYWADVLASVAGDRTGSRIWTFQRSKNTAETRTQIRDAAIESLKWLHEDGIARTVTVEVNAHDSDPAAIQIDVVVVEESGREQAFAFVWDLVRGELQ